MDGSADQKKVTMKIYTKTGDGGETGLPGGTRVEKRSALPEACGAVDELNSCIGVARVEALPQDLDAILESIQHRLLAAGAELADVEGISSGCRQIGPEQVETLEAVIDRHQEALPLLESFVVPGGTRVSAALHHARTVCRRAERRVVALHRDGQRKVSPVLIKYLNRLSDMLFVFARVANAEAGVGDIAWKKLGEQS